MNFPGVTRVCEPVIYGKLLYRELCIDTDFLDECAALWATGEYTQLGLESYKNAFKLSDVEFLKKFGSVGRIRITLDHPVDLGSLQIIKSTLTYLQINDDINSVSDLHPFEALKSLSIGWDKKTAFPDVMSSLEFLGLSRYKPQDGTLRTLPNAPALRSLGLVQARKLISLDGVERFEKLTELHAAYCPALQHIDAIGDLANLQELELESIKNVQGYAALGNLSQLRKLIIDKAARLNNIQWASGLRRLEHLVIRQAAIEDYDLSPLFPLPLLSHIYLDNKKEYEPVLGELKKLVRVRKKAAE